jgi:Tol biopolymer transport system component/DNA-binding winged helix-turn-helix (wHTH) protein
MQGNGRAGEAFRFGVFEVDPRTGELRKAGSRIRVQDQPFKVLLALLEHPGEVVTREELQQRIWPTESFGDFDHAVNVAVAKLRTALGDSAESPRYIETLHRRGYRFVFPVTPPTASQTEIVAQSDGAPGVTSLIATTQSATRNWLWVTSTVTASVLILAIISFAFYKWRGGGSTPTSQLTQRQLTDSPPENFVMTGAISADGKYLAYQDQTGLFVRNLQSGETRPIALPPDSPLSKRWLIAQWFPDGEKLLVATDKPDIWIVTIVGQAPPQEILQSAFAPSISPDGNVLAFLRFPSTEIWVSGPNGEAAHSLLASAGAYFSPVWSPDGRWIAYETEHQSASDPRSFDRSIQILPAAGGTPKALLSESDLPKSYRLDRDNYHLRWSPDGRLVFTASSKENDPSGDDNYSIWLLPMDLQSGKPSGPPHQLTQTGDLPPFQMTFTLDGRKLALVKMRVHDDVYVLDLDRGVPKTPRRLTLDNHDNTPEVWSSDSRAILFDSDRTGKSELFRQGLNDSIPETVASGGADTIDPDLGGDTTSNARPSISPDGVWIFYWEMPRVPAPHPTVQLMRQLTDGGPPEEVLELPYADAVDVDLTCPWKRGASCVLEKREGDNMVFYTIDPVRGKGPRLGEIDSFPWYAHSSWDVSPDGSQIAVVSGAFEDRIKILTSRTRTWRELAVNQSMGNFQSIAWEADGQGFFVTAESLSSFNIVHVALSGKADLVLNNAHRQWMFGPVPSPDGKHLAFQAQTWDNNVWLLENF